MSTQSNISITLCGQNISRGDQSPKESSIFRPSISVVIERSMIVVIVNWKPEILTAGLTNPFDF